MGTVLLVIGIVSVAIGNTINSIRIKKLENRISDLQAKNLT